MFVDFIVFEPFYFENAFRFTYAYDTRTHAAILHSDCGRICIWFFVHRILIITLMEWNGYTKHQTHYHLQSLSRSLFLLYVFYSFKFEKHWQTVVSTFGISSKYVDLIHCSLQSVFAMFLFFSSFYSWWTFCLSISGIPSREHCSWKKCVSVHYYYFVALHVLVVHSSQCSIVEFSLLASRLCATNPIFTDGLLPLFVRMHSYSNSFFFFQNLIFILILFFHHA